MCGWIILGSRGRARVNLVYGVVYGRHGWLWGVVDLKVEKQMTESRSVEEG